MTTSAGRAIRCFAGWGLLLFVGLPWLMVSCAEPVETGVVSFSGQTMGTTYRVGLAAQTPRSKWPPDTSEVQQRVKKRFAEINRLMSTYDPESELSQFNESHSRDWFAVSDDTAHVVAFALEVAEKTGGAFDPTVGPVVNLWGFGPGKRREEPPTEDTIRRASLHVGYQKISVRSDPPALSKKTPEVVLDLSAVAKGYAVDQVAELLSAQGFGGAMVEVGGEVRTFGTKPDQAPWRIAIEKYPVSGGDFQQILELRAAAIATSGDYHNFFESNNVRYSHTIDPQTGRPVQHSLAVVSVHAETCMEADALATALLVMGAERGVDWCERHEVAALFQIRHEQEFTVRATSCFERLQDLPEPKLESVEK